MRCGTPTVLMENNPLSIPIAFFCIQSICGDVSVINRLCTSDWCRQMPKNKGNMTVLLEIA